MSTPRSTRIGYQYAPEEHAVSDGPKIVFFYGSREVLGTGLARDILKEAGAIRETLLRCERLISGHLGWSLQAVCAGGQFASEEVREPALAALQIALTEGWRERGVMPDIVAGRCAGEFAAEYARGTLTIEGAIE